MSLRILLIGNYAPDRQQSMQRYAWLLLHHVRAAGPQVNLVVPGQIISRFIRCRGELAKWIGHAEKFLLFPVYLFFHCRQYDIIHICDHGNAPYLYVLSNRPTVVTCHDCLAIRAGRGEFAPVRIRWTGRIAQRIILASLRRARHVVCVSEATRCDLAELSGRPDSATVIPNVLPYPFRRMARQEAFGYLQRLGIEQRPFFVHVGGNDWYKNRAGVLKIFRELVGDEQFRDHHLVLIGAPLPKEFRDWLAEQSLCGRVLVRQDISNEELCAIYTLAEALLFPSLYEGFGWPILEAQACGCPVVTSRREPMISVAGRAAILIDPLDVCRAGREIVSRWRERDSVIARGYENAQRYDPREFIEAYAEVYGKVAVADGQTRWAALGRRRRGGVSPPRS
jgi:glycosyltransferase involved in cell wall biosynthesis